MTLVEIRAAEGRRASGEFASNPLSPAGEIFRREPVLAFSALLLALSVVPTLAAMVIEARTIHGVNVWEKVLKFEVALAVYLATLAWFSAWLPRDVLASRAYRLFRGVVLFCVLGEMLWIGGAAANGVASHFNTASPHMAALYPLMGIFAVTLTSMTLIYAIVLHRHDPARLPPAFRLSLILGLAITFFATVITAGTMSAGTGHWVGGVESDAGGLPIMGWARTGGDLRVSHFLATHAMHFIPLFGWMISRGAGSDRMRAVWIFAMLYTVFVAFTFWQALAGQAFMPFLFGT